MKDQNKTTKDQIEITKKNIIELSDEELDKVAGGVICPPGCKYIQNACNCD